MPKDLTDVSQWEEDVEVPVDTDPADAASVEVGFQALTDRSRWLFDRIARIFGCNLVPTDTQLVNAVGKQLTSFVYDELNDWPTFFWHNAAGSQVHETVTRGGEIWPAISLVYSGAGTITGLDAAASQQGRRNVVVSGINDIVRQDLNGAGWGACTFTGGAPGKNWISIGCDRDATGGGYKFLIGDDGAGPAAPVVWASTNGTSYTAVGTFPTLTAGYQIAGIFHTQHPVDALGPDDPGNPSWLIIVTNASGGVVAILRSTDGATWTQAAVSWAGTGVFTRAAAYSRLGQRWVVAMQGAALGDVRYSDDNGATWTTVSSAFVPTSSTIQMACDGLGTFIAWAKGATSSDSEFFISVDNGETWESVATPFDHTSTPATAWNVVIGQATAASVKRAGAIFLGAHDSGVQEPSIYRTLRG